MASAEVGRTTDAAPGGRRSPLEGRWRVARLGGLLPPMVGVSKEIRGDRGTVHLGPLWRLSFRVHSHGESTKLVYDPPLSAMLDELRAGPENSWVGRTLFGGYELGRFRMTRVGD